MANGTMSSNLVRPGAIEKRRLDDTLIYLHCLSPIHTTEGVLVSSAIRDLSVRKKAEDKFRALLEAAPDAMVMVNSLGRITLVNAQTEKLFGYEKSELIGSRVEVLIPERYRGQHPRNREGFF